MLQEPKKMDLKSTDPYDCALQLQDILTRTNLAPIMTMVLYEFLDDVLDKRISFDTTIYEHIQNLFEEKLQISVIGLEEKKALLTAKAKAYLILLLEIICHAKLTNGLYLDLQALQGAEQTHVNVKLNSNQFCVTKRGIDFIKNVEALRENNLKGSRLVESLTELTMTQVNYIVDKYRSKEDKLLEMNDVIVIDSVQA